jgi:type III secretory pathway component EscV
MLGFAVIPGMPTTTFLILFVVMGGVGYMFFKGERHVVDPKTGKAVYRPSFKKTDRAKGRTVFAPISYSRQ